MATVSRTPAEDRQSEEPAGAEVSPVSPELAGGPLGYRDRAPPRAGRGDDALHAQVASASTAAGVSEPSVPRHLAMN